MISLDDDLSQLVLDSNSTPLSLEHTLNCGQVFRWEKKNKYWYGIVDEKVIKLRQEDNILYYKIFPEDKGDSLIQRYLRLDDDLPGIITKIDKDLTIKKTINAFYGLRIVRQNIWECLISYICATFSNIPRIKGMIRNLSKKFGKEISYDGLTFYTFPTIDALTKATSGELLDCRLGFRATYIKGAVNKIKSSQNDFDFKYLKRLSYLEAKRHLLTIPGVGPKVADCILLFSLDKLESFPVDVWIKRILSMYYDYNFPNRKFLEKKEITSSRYNELSAFGRRYFGEYAGYAQEYLYHYYRLNRLFIP